MVIEAIREKTFSFGGCAFERQSPPREKLDFQTKILNLELSLEDALKLVLAIDECCRKINRYDLSTIGGKRARIGLALHLESQRIVAFEAKAKAKAKLSTKKGGSLPEKAVYDGRISSNPVGGPGISSKKLQVCAPIKGGAKDGVKVGSGANYVNVGLRLSGGRTAKKVILPAGLSMVPSSSQFQNGVLVQDVQINVPANKEEQFFLQMYCANESRKTPGENVSFSIGPILSSPGLNELIESLRDKAIPTASARMVQIAVWEVTEGRGLSAESRSAIHKLAAAYR